MTKSEFAEWLKYHVTYYPGVGTWFEKMPLEQKSGITDRWQSVLSGIRVTDAKRATEELYEQERQPQAYERHAAIVKRLALDLAGRKFDTEHRLNHGDKTYRCRLCQDTGLVTIYATGDLFRRLAAVYGEERAAKRTQAVGCSCDAGDRVAQFSLRYVAGDMELVQPNNYSPPATPEDYQKVKAMIRTLGGAL